MPGLIDDDYLRRIDQRERDRLLNWYRTPREQAGGPQKPPDPQDTDEWWARWLQTTSADMMGVMVNGLTLGVIKPKNIPALGRIIEEYGTPEERKSALQKVVEFGGEMLVGAVIGGPLLSIPGRAAAGLLRAGASGAAKTAVRGAVEGGILGTSQAISQPLIGAMGLPAEQETLAGAAMKIGGGAVLGGVVGGALGRFQDYIAKRTAARLSNKIVTDAKGEASYEAAWTKYAKDLEEHPTVVGGGASDEATTAEEAAWGQYAKANVPPEGGRPVETVVAPKEEPRVGYPPREPIAALPPAPPPPNVETQDPRKLLKLADNIESSLEGKSQRYKDLMRTKVDELREQAMALQATDTAVDVVAEITARKEWPAWRKALISGGMAGKIEDALILKLGQSILGAFTGSIAGATLTDTPENKIQNALIGAGIGAVAGPLLLGQLSKAIAKRAPELEAAAAKLGATAAPTAESPLAQAAPQAAAIGTLKIEKIGTEQAKRLVQEGMATSVIGDKVLHLPWLEAIEKGEHVTKSGVKSLDGVIQQIAKEFRSVIDVERRGIQTEAMRQAGAEALGMSLDDFLAKTRGSVLNDQEVTAFSGMVKVLNDRTKELAKLSEVTPSTEIDTKFANTFSVLVAATRKMFGFTAESGRSLGAWNQMPSSLKGSLDDATRISDLLGTDTASEMLRVGITPKQVRRMYLSLVDRQARSDKIQGLGDWIGKMQGGFIEAWINGLLSNPTTHVVNFLGNMIPLFGAISERAMAARFHPQAVQGVMKGEATEMAYGLFSGILDAWKAAALSYRRGVSAWDALSTKVETGSREAISSAALALDPLSNMGKAVDYLGNVVRQPGKLMQASDEFFKVLNYRMEWHALTYRMAKQLTAADGDFASTLARLRTDTPDSLMRSARKFAEYQTYTAELGKFGQALAEFSNKHPIVKLMVPFVRTPLNILNYTWEHTPVLNLLSAQVRRDLLMGGPERDLALAKMTLGGMTLGAISMIAGAGMITGRGPEDKVLRRRLEETGWQPYSLKIGDTYYSYQRVDPVGAMLGWVADYSDAVAHAPEQTTMAVAAAMWTAFTRNVTSKTYMQGVANALEMITDQSLSSTQKFQGYFELQAKSLVPRVVSQVTRTTTDPTLREVNSIIDSLISQIPGMSANLPPRRDLFGNPVQAEGGLGPDIISPIYTKTAKLDAVRDEIARQQVSLSTNREFIYGVRPPESPLVPHRAGQGIPLTPQQQDRWSVLAGNQVKVDNANLYTMLEKVIASPEYKSMTDGPDGGKARYLQRIVNRYNQLAEERMLIEYPELQTAIDRKRIERYVARTGVM